MLRSIDHIKRGERKSKALYWPTPTTGSEPVIFLLEYKQSNLLTGQIPYEPSSPAKLKNSKHKTVLFSLCTQTRKMSEGYNLKCRPFTEF